MTIKDKAKELAEMYFFEARTNSYCRQASQQACEMMAHWVVNNACEWLNNHLDCFTSVSPDGEMYWHPNWKECFKKAMEGGDET